MQKLSSFLLVLAIWLPTVLRTEAQICGRDGDTCYFFDCCDGFECVGSFNKACKSVEGDTTNRPGEESTTTKAPESDEDVPTTTGKPEKVVYTTIKFVTKEYLMSNFPGTEWDDGDNSTEASLTATTLVPSESVKPSVEPSGDKTTTTKDTSQDTSKDNASNTQASDQRTEKHGAKDKQTAQKQDQQIDHPFNRTGSTFNSTHPDTGLHSNQTGLHSNHTGLHSNQTDHNSTHTGGLFHPNHTGIHSNHSSSSSAPPLSSFYFLLYLPFVTTMWYFV